MDVTFYGHEHNAATMAKIRLVIHTYLWLCFPYASFWLINIIETQK